MKKLRRAMSILLTVVMVFNSNIVMATETTNSQNVKEGVIKIKSVKDLKNISDDLTGNYILMKNLDLNDEEWDAIGDNGEPFIGTFDGNGHIISNMHISVEESEDTKFVGLFGCIDNAKINNLALENVTIESRTTEGVYGGAIVGKMKNSSIKDCYVSGIIKIGEKGAYTIGGIAGAVFQNSDETNSEIDCNISSCISNMKIDINGQEHGESGSIAGYVENTALVDNCYSIVDNYDLFGSNVDKDNTCKWLNEESRKKENSYIGFDFEKVWKITEEGAKLQNQKNIPDNIEKFTEKSLGDKDSITESTSEITEKNTQEVETNENKVKQKSVMRAASSGDLTDAEFTYTVSGNNATITGYMGKGGNIVIPDTIDGYNVTAIGNSAFSGKDSITGVTFVTTKLTSIGYYAFKGTYISSITIPKTVTSCGYTSWSSPDGPFSGATQLKEVTFEEGMTTIPSYVLASATNTSYVTKVNMPNSINTVGNSAFYKCTSIAGMTLSTGLTTIDESAYEGCSALASISFPETLTKINSEAFRSSGLKTVTFPNSIQTLGGSAFYNCDSLQSVKFTDKDANGYQASIGSSAFADCGSLTDVKFSINVTSIGDNAFYGDSEITTITLPSKLTSIGYYAFKGTYISSITIPKTVTSCGYTSWSSPDGPFSGATQLKEVTFEEGMTTIPSYVLASATNTSYVTKVIIPETVRTVGNYAFYKCDNITIYGYKNSYAETYANENNIPFVSVAIAKNATASEIISKMNLNSLINNVSLGSDKINGPTVTIGGKTFSLFSIDAGLSIPLGNNVQAKVDQEKKTVQVLIGFDKIDGSATLDKGTNSTNYWSESYQQVKSLYTGVTGKKVDSTKLWNQFSKLRGKLRKYDLSMGISASASVAGYAEFSYASGEIVFSQGGVVMEAALGTSLTYELPPCPAVYVTFGLDAGFNGELKLVRESSLNYSPAMNAGIDLSATLGVGAGNKKIKTYAELGLKGTVSMGVELPAKSLSDALTARLSAMVYFDSKVFGFNGPSYGPQEFASYQLYPQTRSKMRALFNGADLAEFEADEATLSDRSYLKTNAVSAYYAHENNELFNKTNLYQYNAPKLAYLNDGSMLLVWIDDNGQKSGINKTSLMYSVYNGSSWSEAKTIGETGGANDYPAIYCDGNKVQIIWQKAEKLSDNNTLTDLLKSVDLYSVTYANGTMGEVSRITSGNISYEMMQSVASDGDKTSVVWVENSNNNPFQGDGTNTIKSAEYINGEWKQNTIAEGLSEVSNLNADYVSGVLTVTYETTDTEEGKIHLIRGNEKKNFVGTGSEIEGGMIYYCTEQGLMSYDIIGKMSENVINDLLGDFTVLDNGTDKMIVSTVYDGFTSEFVAYTFDRSVGKWSDAVTLTDKNKYIRDYSAVLDKNGHLVTALNLVDVDEDADEIYGNAQLSVMNISETVDIQVGTAVSFDENMLSPNSELPLTFEVTNNGVQEVDNLNVILTDEQGNEIQSGKVNCSIQSGKTVEVSYNYKLPETLSHHTVKIKVYADTETRLSDNETTVEIGDADVSVDNLYISGNSTLVTLKGTINNLGYNDAKEVVVTVYDKNDRGDVIGTADLATVKMQKNKEFSIEVPQAYLDVNPLTNGNTLYVAVSTSSEELNYSNNSSEYLIKSSTDEPLVLNQKEVEMNTSASEQIEITYSSVTDVSENNIEWKSSDETIVKVADGKITAIGSGEATVTATVNGYTVECKVTVSNQVSVTGIYMEETSVKMLKGNTKQLNAYVLPQNATNKKISWKTEDSSIATVSSGLVTGVNIGTTTITAYTDDGYKLASCIVTVTQDASTTYKATFSGGDNTVGKKPGAITALPGMLVTLPNNTYTKEGYIFAGWSDGENVYDEGAVFRMPYENVSFTAQWTVSGKKEFSIASSAQTGGSITPNGTEKVVEDSNKTYTVKADDGYYIADVKVDGVSVGAVSTYTFENVSENHTIEAFFNKNASVKVEKIELDNTEVELNVGDSLLLNAVIIPDKAEDKQIKWSTNNIEVASVENGLIKAIGEGTAVITAEAQDGSGVKAQCIVTVSKKKQIFTGTIKYEKTYGDAAFYLDTELIEGDGDVEYSTSDSSVITVSGSGRVVIKKAGTATITVKSSETDKYAETDYDVEIVVGKAQQILSGTSNYNKKTGDTAFKLDTRIDEGDGHLSYVSDNENIVTVSEGGQISIHGAGTATVTVTTSETDNYLASSIKVTIVVSKGTSEQESTTPSETEEITTPKPTEQPTSSKPTEKPTTQKVETTQNSNKVKKPSSTKIKSVKKAKKSLKITWKKVKGITGYQIQYSTSSKFKKAKKITIKKANTVSKTIKKLQAKKKYYVRIRTYISVNGKKKYSSWSKKKSQKTK